MHPNYHEAMRNQGSELDVTKSEREFKNAVRNLEASGLVEKHVIEEPGCEPLVVYVLGTPKFLFNGHIHGDESGSATLMFIKMSELILAKDPRVKDIMCIPRCNEGAYRQLERGVALDAELYQRLVDAKALSPEEQERISPQDLIDVDEFQSVLRQKNVYISISEGRPYIDLNRQFIEETDFSIPELSQLFPKARQLIRAMQQFGSEVVQGFSFHNDNEEGIGAYMYDTPKRFPWSIQADPQLEAIISQRVVLWRERMKSADIPLLSGYDDQSDPYLGLLFSEGYNCTPATVKMVNNTVVLSSEAGSPMSFENAMVRWFESMQRCWCFETPGWMNETKQDEVVAIFLEVMVLPIVEWYHSRPDDLLQEK